MLQEAMAGFRSFSSWNRVRCTRNSSGAVRRYLDPTLKRTRCTGDATLSLGTRRCRAISQLQSALRLDD